MTARTVLAPDAPTARPFADGPTSGSSTSKSTMRVGGACARGGAQRAQGCSAWQHVRSFAAWRSKCPMVRSASPHQPFRRGDRCIRCGAVLALQDDLRPAPDARAPIAIMRRHRLPDGGSACARRGRAGRGRPIRCGAPPIARSASQQPGASDDDLRARGAALRRATA
eukprot:scaffold103227_cov22-Tisochrysis_lutea.AAC.2